VFFKVKNAITTLAMAYCGQGSDKQVAWAASIYNKDMQRAIDGYADAQRRVREQTMPTLWTAMWDQVLSDSRVVEVVSRYASQSARDTIDYKGFKSSRGSASVGMWIEKLASEEYNKAKAAGAEMVYA
jgi:type II secretory pathway pseudopilin PulG